MDAYKNKLERYNYTIYSNNYINVIIYFENKYAIPFNNWNFYINMLFTI